VELQVYHGTRYIDEVVGLRVKDLGRLLDMRELPHARCAGTAREGQVYASQGERSERLSVADRTGRRSEQGRERQTLRPARRTRWAERADGREGDILDY